MVRLELIIECEVQAVCSHSCKLRQSSPVASNPSYPGMEALLSAAGTSLNPLEFTGKPGGTLTDVTPGKRRSLTVGDDGS